jgi:drug/metabolite transporter (DMT)-like permease
MHNQQKAYLFALLAVFCWSTIAVAFKISLRYCDPFQIVFLASLFSLLFFLLLNLWKSRFRGLISSLKRKDIARSAWLGFLNPFLYYVILLHAYDLISAQEAMTLNYIWPIMLALLSVPLLGQKMGLLSMIAMIISFGGILVIATKGDFEALSFTNATGTLLAAGSSLIWALYWIFNLKDHREIPDKLMLNFFFGTIYALIALLIFSTPVMMSVGALGSGAYLGLFEMGLTFLLWMTALKYSKKTYLVSQLIFLSPFLSLIWIRVVLKEPILTSTILGLLLILAGIILQQQQEKRISIPK